MQTNRTKNRSENKAMNIDSFPFDLEKNIELARKYFDEGWSIHVSMRKAGFKATWQTKGEIVKNHVIKKMLNDNNERWKNKRMILSSNF